MNQLILKVNYSEGLENSDFKLELLELEKLTKTAERELKEIIKKKVNAREIEVNLTFCSDDEIREINREYREKDKPTDVISFDFHGDKKSETMLPRDILGDIIISVDTTKKQAKEKKHSFLDELKILYVHGLLHTLGFDHQNDEQEEEMEKWAKKVLEG